MCENSICGANILLLTTTTRDESARKEFHLDICHTIEKILWQQADRSSYHHHHEHHCPPHPTFSFKNIYTRLEEIRFLVQTVCALSAYLPHCGNKRDSMSSANGMSECNWCVPSINSSLLVLCKQHCIIICLITLFSLRYGKVEHSHTLSSFKVRWAGGPLPSRTNYLNFLGARSCLFYRSVGPHSIQQWARLGSWKYLWDSRNPD